MEAFGAINNLFFLAIKNVNTKKIVKTAYSKLEITVKWLSLKRLMAGANFPLQCTTQNVNSFKLHFPFYVWAARSRNQKDNTQGCFVYRLNSVVFPNSQHIPRLCKTKRHHQNKINVPECIYADGFQSNVQSYFIFYLKLLVGRVCKEKYDY